LLPSPLQASLQLQLPADFFTAIGISSLLAGFAAVISLVVTLRQDRESKILAFLSDTNKVIAHQLEIEKDLKDLEDCIVYAYNYLDILEGIAFLRVRNKIPEYVARYYKSFFEYGITMMAWYASIPEREGSSAPYDKRNPSDNWPELVGWLANERQMKAYGVKHLPPQMAKELERCKVDKSAMFARVRSSIGPFEVV